LARKINGKEEGEKRLEGVKGGREPALISLKWIKIRHRCSLPEFPTVASQLALLFFHRQKPEKENPPCHFPLFLHTFYTSFT